MEARAGYWWRTRFAFIGVGLLFFWAAASARATSRIYWGDETTDAISSANLDNSGGGSTLSTVGATAPSNPSGTAIDVATGKIYWVNQSGTKVSFANLDGTGGGDLNTTGATVNSAEGLAIDPAAGKLYWANELGASPISFANLDGSGGGDLNVTGATPNEPSGLAIDPAAGKVYWANFGGNTISFANLDNSGGGGQLNISGATANGPAGVAIDLTSGKIFWTNFSGNTISFANLAGTGGGGQLSTTGATPNEPWGLAIDPVSGKLYWANFGSGSLAFANLNGSGGGSLSAAPLTPVAPDFPSLLEPPAGTKNPAVTGGSTPRTTLACSQGSWASDLLGSYLYRVPRSFTYSWTRNGTPVTGAASSSIVVSSPGTYACTVTAQNQAGSSSQTSAPHKVSALALSGLRVSPPKFSLTGRKVNGKCVKPTHKNSGDPRCRRPIKLKLSYTLNAADTVTFKLKREARGRKVNGRCVKPTTKNGKRPRCTRLIAVPGKLTRAGTSGPNSFIFNGEIGGRKLGPGIYQLTATPRGGAAHKIKFKVLR